MTTVWLKGEGPSARPDPDPAILNRIDLTTENLIAWLYGVLDRLRAPAGG
jgi:hypothetical protein